MQRVKSECEETEKALRERVQRLEMARLQLEEDISHMKTASITDKLHADENINIAKQKVKIEEVRKKIMVTNSNTKFRKCVTLYKI